MSNLLIGLNSFITSPSKGEGIVSKIGKNFITVQFSNGVKVQYPHSCVEEALKDPNNSIHHDGKTYLVL